jgi:TIGR03009 family protein
MALSRMILLSPMIALLTAGFVGVHAQEPVPGQAAQPAARAQRGVQPAQAQRQPQPANDPAKMKWLLEKWAAQSAKLKTLDVHIYRIDTDFKWKDELQFDGRAVFKRPNLAYLDFKKVKMAPNAKGQQAPVKDSKTGKVVTTPNETIVCAQNEVWQYLYEGRQIYIWPLAKGERQRALDEGPLPFLFDMKVAEAKARYEMFFQGEYDKFYLVKVLPKLQEDKESFKMALLYLEKTYLLPARIALLSPDGKSSRDFFLDNHRPNREVPENIFLGGRLKGWTVQVNPAVQAPQQGNAAGRPGAANGGALRR